LAVAFSLAALTALSAASCMVLSNDEVETRILEDFPPLLHVGAFQAKDDGNLDVGLFRCFHHALSQRVDAQNATEDV